MSNNGSTALAPATAPVQPTALIPRGLANISSTSELMQLADILFRAGVSPKGVGRPETAAAIILMGQEVGLRPMQALQSIKIVNGRASMWGDALLALVRGSGKLEAIAESVQGDGDARHGRCAVTRRGEPERVFVFSVADAKKANLWGKAGPWTEYPDRMLLMRPRGFALRDVFPDVLCGLIPTEEADDIPTVEVIHAQPASPPAAAAPLAAPAHNSTAAAPQALPAAATAPPVQGELMITDQTLIELGSKREDFMLRHARVQPSDQAYNAEWKKVLKALYKVESAKQLTEADARQFVALMDKPTELMHEELRKFF